VFRACIVITIVLMGCVEESPPSPPPEMSLSFLPGVFTSTNDYYRADIDARIPDSTSLNACRAAYNGRYTDQLKAALVASLVQKAIQFGSSETEIRGCLNATGELRPGVISLPYRAERAKYYGTQCWILEFAWGASIAGMQEFKCYVMDAGTFNPRLILTSVGPVPLQH